MAIDKPAFGVGSGPAVHWYSGDSDPSTSSPPNPPANSLYWKRDSSPAAGIPRLFQNYGTSATPIWRVMLGPNVIDVRRFGARGDGLADDTSPIQRGLDEAKAHGGM